LCPEKGREGERRGEQGKDGKNQEGKKKIVL